MEQDTSLEGRRRYEALLRNRSGPDRLEAAVALTGTVRELCWVGLKRRYPEASQRELRLRFVELVYGPELAGRVKARL